MPQNKNTFIKGMDQDTSQQKYQPEKYIAARNFRPLTDEGLSTGAMENIQGTAIQHMFPEVAGFIELDFNSSAYDVIEDDQGTPVPQQGHIHLAFSVTPATGYPGVTIIDEIIEFTSPRDYIDQVVTLITDYNANLPTALQIELYRKDDYDRLILRGPLYGIVNLVDDGFMTSKVRAVMKDFYVLGSTHLRDRNIIFTVSQPDWPNTVLAEGDLAPGQIWQMVYDPEFPTQARELKLIYFGDLRFSLNHPIEAIAHYENEERQVVYWTDNYNPPRKLNIVDPDAFILREDDLLLNNKATLMPALPSYEEQEGGALPSGIFYITYKLQKFGGSTTGIAPWSSPIPVHADKYNPPGTDTNYEFINYPIDTIGTTKTLNYVIPELPQGFDKIYVYAVYEKTPKEYFVYLIEETLLDDSQQFNIRLSSVGDKRKLKISQLQEFDVDFETVKTMTIKDNQLLLGNVKLAAFDLDWDARAYRFKPGTSNSYVTVPSFNVKNWGISLTSNAINPHNDDRTAEKIDYRYKRNSNELGGSGPNVSYVFTWKNITLDQSSRANPSNTDYYIGDNTGDPGLHPERTPFVNVDTRGDIDLNVGGRDDFQTQVSGGPGFPNFKNNRYEAYFKGYMRDEVYRFGIVFYSLTGKPSEVKWIGDIRFPSEGDLPPEAKMCRYHGYNNFSPGNGLFDVPESTGIEDRQASIGASLGIKFTVDVRDIADKISGYSIVRAPRLEKDRTIVAQGAMGEVREIQTYNPRTGNRDSVLFNYTRIYDSDASGVTSNEADRGRYCTLDCPDLKFPSGARIFDYVGLRDEPEDNYYLKPVAGYVHATESDDRFSAQAPEIVGSPWSTSGNSPKFRYAKSLLRISDAPWDLRLGFSKDDGTNATGLNAKGQLNAIVKVGANAAVTLTGTTFSNRGMTTTNIDYPDPADINDPQAPLNVTGETTLASPGCQTVLCRGTFQGLNRYVINAVMGHGGNTIDDEPYNDNDIGSFAYDPADSKKDRTGHTAIVDIYRFPKDQYGGNTYEARQSTQYISTGHFAPVFPSDTAINSDVFGGDIHISAFAEKKLFGQVPRDANNTVLDANGVPIPQRVVGAYMGPIVGRIYPVATVINPEMRAGFHFNNYIQGSGGDIDLREEAQDDYLIPAMYHREKDLQTYFVEGAGNSLVGTYDNRVYISNPKINGERSDSWSVIKPLNKYDVDGLYGPINKLITLNELVVFFQDRAFGRLSVNPTAIIPSVDNNTAIQLGTGKGIQDAIYVSNSIGCFHQWGITKSRSAVYWFDAVHKKFVRFNGQGVEVLSDMKQMSSWFHNKVEGSVIVNDNPILYNGIACTYDYKFNEIIFTFHTDLRVPTSIYSLADQPLSYMQDQLADAALASTTLANNPGGYTGFAGATTQYANLANQPINSSVGTTQNGTLSGSTVNSTINMIPATGSSSTSASGISGVDSQTGATSIFRRDGDPSVEDYEFINATDNCGYDYITTVREITEDRGGRTYQVDENICSLIPGTEWDQARQRCYVGTIPPDDCRDNATPVDCYEIINPRDRIYGEDICGRAIYTYYTDHCKLGKSVRIDTEERCGNAGGYWDEETGLCYVNYADSTNPLTNCYAGVDDPIQINPINIEPTYPTVTALFPPVQSRWYETIVFNENIDQFSSFYDHFPTHYINDGRRFFSQSPKDNLHIHIHEIGKRTNFYEQYFPPTMELVVNPKGDHTKVFTNVEMFTIVSDATTNVDRFNETFTVINYYNEYQNTGDIALTPDINIQRRMRTWRTAIPRDTSGSNARIRNPYMKMYMEYTTAPNTDTRLVVHDITTHYTDVPM